MQLKRRSGWKSVTTALALGASTLVVGLPASAQGINVFVDGNTVNFGGVPPTSAGGRVLVPLRGVFEALGAVVDYNAATRTIDALRGDTRLRLTIGSTLAFVNDQAVRLEVPAQTSLGRTLVPLRFVGEALGAQVQWDAAQRAVLITSPVSANPLPTPRPTPRPTPVPDPIDPIDPIDPVVNDDTVSGSFVRVNSTQRAITIRANNVDRTYLLARNASFERRPLLNRSTMENPEFGSSIPIPFGGIQVNETVQLTLNNANQVTRVTSTPSVYVAQVRSANGTRIILDDDANTQLTIGPNLRFINSQGREVTTSNLRAGDEVVLFVSPDTRRIYQISAARNDLNSAYGRDVNDPYLPPDGNDNGGDNGGNNNPDNGDTPQIDQVTFAVNRSRNNQNQNQDQVTAKAGDTVTVTVRGTPGLRGTFEVTDRGDAINLRERPNRPGEYTGTYIVRAGDDVLNGRVTVRLTGANGQDITEQSENELTIDTLAPRIVRTTPANGATTNNTQPNITIFTDDVGGSDLAPSTITLTNRGQTFEAETTVTRNTLRAVSPRALSGRVDVSAEVMDEAGNVATSNFSFTVRGGTETGGNGSIDSVFHNANRVLQNGDVLTVDMIAQPGGRATFDLLDADNRVISQGNSMTEIGQGRYRGTYTIRERDGGQLRIVGRFRDADGQTSTSETDTTVEVVGGTDATLTAPTILAPLDGTRVDAQTTVRGRGTPGNIIEVSIRAEGTQYYVFEYKEEIGTAQVRVRNNGSWETQPLNLPAPRNVTGLRYVISATQTDGADRTSEPATVTLRPQQ